jgi:hypothetical protein
MVQSRSRCVVIVSVSAPCCLRKGSTIGTSGFPLSRLHQLRNREGLSFVPSEMVAKCPSFFFFLNAASPLFYG